MNTQLKYEPPELFHHFNDLEETILENLPNVWGPVKLTLGAWARGFLQTPITPLRVNLIGDLNLGSATVLDICQDLQCEYLSLGNIPHLDQPT